MSRELEGVKVGDKIKVMNSYGPHFMDYMVQRVTATKAVCDRGAEFKIDNGLMIGTGDYRRPIYGSFLTDADQARSDMALRIATVRDSVRRIEITSANLEAAEAFIATSQPKEPAK